MRFVSSSSLRCSVAVAAALFAGAATAPARADLAGEVGQGRSLAETVQSGEKECADLSAADFELVGEYVMGRYLGDGRVHEAMNARMKQMMGESGEAAMHAALGRRYTGCEGGPDDGWAMPMIGMMGGTGGYGAPSGPPDAYGGEPRGPGMMGLGHPGFAAGDGDVSAMAVVAIALGAGVLGGLLVAVGFWLGGRPGRRPGVS